MQSYTSHELSTMNLKYGGGWITNVKSTEDTNKRYHLYPTGNCTIRAGREYIAVDSTKKLTADEKQRLNII